MRVAIIGSGHVGTALATAIVRAGHSVHISAAHPEHAETAARASGAAPASDNRCAVEGAGLVILAVPSSVALTVADEIADLTAGKTVIDVTNPVNGEMSGLTTGRSAAEDLQERLPGAHVVKAFNTVFAKHQAQPTIGGEPLDGFFAGDDADAKKQVAGLLKELGYRPVDSGPLSMARALEDMELLNIRLNAKNGWSWETEWRLVGPRS